MRVFTFEGESKSGVVESVLPTGTPLIATPESLITKYWFVSHRPSAQGTLKYQSQAEDNSFEGDDDDPLITMENYLTMDSAMLREAENMRRNWFESQQLKEATKLRLDALEGVMRIRRLEASCHHVVLRKAKEEKMGTNFASQNTLILTAVELRTAAERSGVGRFVGRQLISIDNKKVENCEQIRAVAAGKDIMNLEFEPTPMCPANHPMQIIFVENCDENRCLGCCRRYSEAYYGCKLCWYDVCGKCGQDSFNSRRTVSEQPQHQFVNTAQTSSPTPQQQQQQQQQLQQQQLQQQVLQQANKPTGGSSWGSTAYGSPQGQQQSVRVAVQPPMAPSLQQQQQQQLPPPTQQQQPMRNVMVQQPQVQQMPPAVDWGPGFALPPTDVGTDDNVPIVNNETAEASKLFDIFSSLNTNSNMDVGDESPPGFDEDASLGFLSSLLDRVHGLPTSPSNAATNPEPLLPPNDASIWVDHK